MSPSKERVMSEAKVTFKGPSSMGVRVALSLFVVFHLLVVFLMPNGSSYPARAMEKVLQPYAAVLGLKTSWNFFSPDPAHTMYLKMTLYWQDDDGDFTREPEEVYFPEARGGRVMDVVKRRELYAMRYLMLDPRRFEALLGPWICRQHAGLSHVQIEHIQEPIPDLERAALFSREKLADLTDVRTVGRVEYSCSQVENEVAL